MTKPDLMAELAEVVRQMRAVASDDDHLLHNWANTAEKAHAELEAAVRDAARWRALKFAEAPIVTVTGAQLAKGIKPGDYAVPWDWPINAKTKIRLIAMRNSAREG
jgi:hypothetical protein